MGLPPATGTSLAPKDLCQNLTPRDPVLCALRPGQRVGGCSKHRRGGQGWAAGGLEHPSAQGAAFLARDSPLVLRAEPETRNSELCSRSRTSSIHRALQGRAKLRWSSSVNLRTHATHAARIGPRPHRLADPTGTPAPIVGHPSNEEALQCESNAQ